MIVSHAQFYGEVEIPVQLLWNAVLCCRIEIALRGGGSRCLYVPLVRTSRGESGTQETPLPSDSEQIWDS